MAMIDVSNIVVGPRIMTYTVSIAEGYPLTTAEDFEATNRIVQLMPELENHVCVSEAGDTFKEALPHTEVAHLLEHMVVELLAQTGRVDMITGQTRKVTEDKSGRTWESRIACEDDTLTIAALSSAVWMMEWAFAGGGEPVPNVEATVQGLNALIDEIDRVPASQRH